MEHNQEGTVNSVGDALSSREPVKEVTHISGNRSILWKMANETSSRAKNPIKAPN